MKLRNNPEQESNAYKKKNLFIVIAKKVAMIIVMVAGLVYAAFKQLGNSKK